MMESFLTLEEDVAPYPSFSVDWREYGFVSPVKSQLKCGGCWAFAVTGALESYIAQLMYQSGSNASSQSRPLFSEQALIDCVDANIGCKGGLLSAGFFHLYKVGVPLADAYPYEAATGTCNSSVPISFRIRGYKPSTGCADLLAAIAIRPVAKGIDARNWFRYKSGIFDNCDKQLNHAVLVVGVSPEYWVIKNQWGPLWGEGGFIRIKYGTTCGICKEIAFYPV